MNCLVLDFETYYDRQYSLKGMSIPEYVHDARFRVHGVAIRWPSGEIQFRVDVADALDQLRRHFGKDLEGTTVLGHHLQFDLYILNHRYRIRPRFFVDTMLLAHHVHGRREKANGQSASLGALAKHYGLQAKGDLDFMCRVHAPDVQQLAELTTYAKHDAELTYQLAALLLPQITRPDMELPILMHTVRLFAERSVAVDVQGVARLEQEINGESERLFREAGVTPEQMSKDKHFHPLLTAALARTGRSLPTKQGKRGMIPATAKKDAAMQAFLEDDDPLVATLAQARVNKKGQDQKIARLATLGAMAQATRGRLPVYLHYYGCHTGRFSGGGGFNIQNLGRGGLGGRIRGLLIPKSGHRFIIADFAQIEARITAWYAGEDQMIQAFTEARDLYSEFASRVLKCEVRKSSDDDPPTTRERLSALRQVGKQAVLGLGFGMGPLKFMGVLRAIAELAPLFDNKDLSPSICVGIVRSFRADYPDIPRFWKALEAGSRHVIDGKDNEVGTLRFGKDSNVMLVRLPSGRSLRYPDLRRSAENRVIKYLDRNGELAEFTPSESSLVYDKRDTLYGGKLCENVVQATARELLVEAILRLESLGLPVLFHIHDEVICEVPTEAADQACATLERELSRTPAWASGLPVACEVQIADRYGK